MFIFFSHWLIKASWRFVVPDLKKSSDEWPVSCSSAHVKLQFKAHKSCVSFGLFNFVSIHTLNKYWFQKFPRSFFYRNRHFTCLGYSFKHHLKPRKVNWRSLFTCKNVDSRSAREFKTHIVFHLVFTRISETS